MLRWAAAWRNDFLTNQQNTIIRLVQISFGQVRILVKCLYLRTLQSQVVPMPYFIFSVFCTELFHRDCEPRALTGQFNFSWRETEYSMIEQKKVINVAINSVCNKNNKQLLLIIAVVIVTLHCFIAVLLLMFIPILNFANFDPIR